MGFPLKSFLRRLNSLEDLRWRWIHPSYFNARSYAVCDYCESDYPRDLAGWDIMIVDSDFLKFEVLGYAT